MRTTAVFEPPAGIRCAASLLHHAGLDPGHLSIIVRDPAGQGEVPPESTLDPRAGRTAVQSGLIGSAVGLLPGLATFTIPGVGRVVAAGPIAAGLSALTAAASAAAAGGIIGAMAGALSTLGMPDDQARARAEAIERGDTVVSVEHDRTVPVARIFRDCGARDVRADP